MDVNHTLLELNDAISQHNRDGVTEHAENIRCWVANDGALPEAHDWRENFSRAQWYGYLRHLLSVAH